MPELDADTRKFCSAITHQDLEDYVLKALKKNVLDRTNQDVTYLYEFMKKDDFLNQIIDEQGFNVALQCLQHMTYECHQKS